MAAVVKSSPHTFFLLSRLLSLVRLTKGWKLVGLKLVTPGRPLLERHYEEHVGKVGCRGGHPELSAAGSRLLSGVEATVKRFWGGAN